MILALVLPSIRWGFHPRPAEFSHQSRWSIILIRSSRLTILKNSSSCIKTAMNSNSSMCASRATLPRPQRERKVQTCLTLAKLRLPDQVSRNSTCCTSEVLKSVGTLGDCRLLSFRYRTLQLFHISWKCICSWTGLTVLYLSPNFWLTGTKLSLRDSYEDIASVLVFWVHKWKTFAVLPASRGSLYDWVPVSKSIYKCHCELNGSSPHVLEIFTYPIIVSPNLYVDEDSYQNWNFADLSDADKLMNHIFLKTTFTELQKRFFCTDATAFLCMTDVDNFCF